MEDLKQKYDEDGYVIVRNAIDKNLILEAERHVHWLLKNNPGIRPEQLHTNLLADDPFWLRLAGDKRLIDITEQFLGPDIALFASHYICKPPKTGQPVLWHQDGSYWPLEPMDVITLWLAVTDSTIENGCMKVIPKSQNMSLQETKSRTDIDNVLASSIDDDLVDESSVLNIILNAGDVSIHHPNIIHGSDSNHSDTWRMGLTLRYIPTSTRITKPEICTAFLFRGKPIAGINTYGKNPKFIKGKHMPFQGYEEWL